MLLMIALMSHVAAVTRIAEIERRARGGTGAAGENELSGDRFGFAMVTLNHVFLVFVAFLLFPFVSALFLAVPCSILFFLSVGRFTFFVRHHSILSLISRSKRQDLVFRHSRRIQKTRV